MVQHSRMLEDADNWDVVEEEEVEEVEDVPDALILMFVVVCECMGHCRPPSLM